MAAHQHEHRHGEHDHAAHAHDHGHSHAPKDFGFTFAIVTALNVTLVVLQVATGAIAWEAIQRFSEADEVAGMTVMIVAALGIVINGISAWLLMAGQAGDLNIRGAFLHLVGDALVSVGVVMAGGLILLTGWRWIDPAASLVISA